MFLSKQFCLNFAHTPAYHRSELQDNSEMSELTASDGQGPHLFQYLGLLYSKLAA